MTSKTKFRLALFIGLTAVFNAIFYMVIASAGTMSVGGGWVVFALMWSPGVAALATQVLTRGTLRGLGWGWGKTRYQLLSVATPLALAAIVYGITWLTGLGGFPDQSFVDQISQQLGIEVSEPLAVTIYILVSMTVSFVPTVFAALGEEIGWRGFLVPELVRWRGYTVASLLSGALWAVWHFPGILLADYGSGVPTLYALVCFSLMAIASSFIYAWLRLKSGSVWTAALFHAGHNVIIQTVLTPLTFDTGPTEFIIDEFGVGMVLAYTAAAFVLWRRRDQLALKER